MNSSAGSSDPSTQTAEAAMTPPPNDPTPPAADSGNPGYTQTKSHNMLYIVVALVVIVGISLIVLFFYQQYRSLSTQETQTPTPVVAQTSPTPKLSPTVTPVNTEESEVQAVVIEDIDKDLSDIEKDMTQL
jgi:uncharacterized protein HemX